MLPQVRHRHCDAGWYRKCEQVHRTRTGPSPQPNDEHECEHRGETQGHLKKSCDPSTVHVRVANPKVEANDHHEDDVCGRAHDGADNRYRYPLTRGIDDKVENQAGREDCDTKKKAPLLEPTYDSRCSFVTLMAHAEISLQHCPANAPAKLRRA